MCLLFFSFTSDTSHPYKLVLVSNRDELYSRPTKPAQFWDDDKVLAGMDMEPGRIGGTWLGITRTGRIATLTNYRQKFSDVKSEAQGRGFLVVDYLCCDLPSEEYLKCLAERRTQFNGYNILTIELKSGKVFYYSNMENRDIQQLAPGIYGLSNKTLDDPWAKLVHGKQKFTDVLHVHQDSKETLVEELMRMMSDDTCHHPGGNYPLLDWPEEYVKHCSSMFVKGFETPLGGYGTRTTTVILVENNDHVTYVERTLEDPIEVGTYRWWTQQFDFDLLTSSCFEENQD